MSSGDRQPSDDENTAETVADEKTPATADADSDTAGDADDEIGGEEEITGKEKTAGDASIGPVETQESELPLWEQIWTAKSGPLLFLKDGLVSILIVTIIGVGLFAISGVWPPMVAVESDSMEPNINQYDLILVTEAGRFASDSANEQGLVMAQDAAADQHSSFGNAGSVIVFDYPGRTGSPIIHRAQFAVDADENWYDRADADSMSASNCEELRNCPAPHDGYITQGDNNGQYDQASGIAPVVKPEWVTGVAQVRVPYLGWLRLSLASSASGGVITPTVAESATTVPTVTESTTTTPTVTESATTTSTVTEPATTTSTVTESTTTTSTVTESTTTTTESGPRTITPETNQTASSPILRGA